MLNFRLGSEDKTARAVTDSQVIGKQLRCLLIEAVTGWICPVLRLLLPDNQPTTQETDP